MTTIVDNVELEQYIKELNSLHSEWTNYKKTPLNQGENSGGTVTEIIEMTESLQSMQEAFVLLLANTLSYMRQRKESVEIKDEEAKTYIEAS